MKKTFRLLIAVLLFSMLLSACGNGTKENEADKTSGVSDADSGYLTISADGISEYQIMTELSQINEKNFATRLQSYISSNFGVLLPLRSSKGSESVADKKIFVSEADDITVQTRGTSVYLGAPDAEGYQILEIILRDYFEYAEGKLKMKNDIDFVYDRDKTENGKYGESITFATDASREYTLVYSAKDHRNVHAAEVFSQLLEEQTGMRVVAAPDTGTYENEIVYGNAERKCSEPVRSRINSSGEYAVGISQGSAVLAGTDDIDCVYALLTFAQMLKNSNTIYESDMYVSSTAKNTVYTVDIALAATAYRDAYGTYSSYVDRDSASLSEGGKREKLLNELLIERLGTGFVVSPGKQSALYSGFVVRLDPSDYTKKTYVSDGEVYIAEKFARSYFGDVFESADDGFINLSSYIGAQEKYKMLFKEKQDLYIVVPADYTALDSDTASYMGFRNREFLERMVVLLDNPLRPEPQNNVEQTRTVIDSVDFDPSLIYDFTVQGHPTMYSPGICTVTENGKEVIYVSYEKCMATMMNVKKELDTVTYLKRSTDGGRTWEDIGSVSDMKWAAIFEHDGDIYVMGTNLVLDGRAVIARYRPAEDTFEYKTMNFSGGGGAPCAVIEANGRIWRASTHVCSAPADSDLFDSSNWTVSARADSVFTVNDFLSITGLSSVAKFSLGEGNIVLKPDGNVYAVFPLDAAPTYGYYIVLRVSDDGKTLSKLDGNASMMSFPSTKSKSSIRYDAQTGLYVTITSLPMSGEVTSAAANTRNVMGIAVSRDMENWTVIDVLMVDREIMSEDMSRIAHGYQYADFDFSGDCIRIVVREASGVTSTYHDGKYITLYTIENYTCFLTEGLARAEE